MAKRIKANFIETLNDRLNIVDIIGARVPSLKKKGRNYQAICPFHNEKTASFSVEPIKGFYKCFGCGVSGNAIKFVMEFEHLTFVEAIEKLAGEVGMTVEYEQDSKHSAEKAKQRKTAIDILELATEYFEKNLSTCKLAQDYLIQRGINAPTSKTFRLGYAYSGNKLLSAFTPEVSASDLEKTGLVAKGDRGIYDQFRQRLMFPIRNHKGQAVGFGGRVLGEGKPKYLNSAESEFFQKRHVLYGLYESLQATTKIERLIVVEGYMDVIALFQSGILGAVATLGTSLTEDHVPLMRRFSHKMCICFDGDQAGKLAAKRAAENLLKSVSAADEIRMIFLPEGEDPDTLVRRIGQSAFNKILDKGQLFSEYLFSMILSGLNPNIVEGRAEINRRSRHIFAQMPHSEYKTLLRKGLNARLGESNIQTANVGHQQFVNNQFKHENPLRPDTNKSKGFSYRKKNHVTATYPRNSQLRLTAEAKLVRILIEYPDLSLSLPNSFLIDASKSQDAQLLKQVIDILLANEHPSAEAVTELLPSPLKMRFQMIMSGYENGWFFISDEGHDIRKQRLSAEFHDTFKQLIDKQLKLMSIRKTPPT